MTSARPAPHLRTPRALTIAAALAAAAASAACQAAPLVAPTQATLTTVVDDTILPAGGSTTVTAFLVELAGTPVQDGTLVTFAASLGAIHPVEAPTVRGRAAATFTAGAHSGIAELRAYSGNAASEPLSVTVGAAAAATVRLAAQPGSLPPQGGDTTLVATVLDARQNPLPAVPVSFATSAGTLQPLIATTDGGGNARSVLSTSASAEVTATAGDHEPATLTVAVTNAPAVSLTASPAAPAAHQPVAFEVDVSPGTRALRRVVLDFGDGRSADLGTAAHASLAHAYDDPGTFTARATATDTAGHRASAAAAIVVSDAPAIPLSLAAEPPAPIVHQPVTFTVTVAPTDDAPDVRNVSLDFGDGDTASLGPLSGTATTAHVYRAAGPVVATATVRDAAGRTAATSLGLSVTDAPTLNASVTAEPDDPLVHQPVVFTVTVERPDGAPDVHDVSLDFGDRSDRHALGALEGSASLVHTYSRAGTFLATVSVQDVTRRTTSTSLALSVADAPALNASVTAEPDDPLVHQPVVFTVTVERPDGAPDVHDVSLDFGDRSDRHALGALEGSASLVHTYSRAGTFLATVSVQDVTRRATSASLALSVAEPPPAPEIGVSLTATPPNAAVGEAITFAVALSAESSAPITSANIDFGDGNNAGLVLTRNRQETAHAYDKPGAFVVAVSVSDTDGARGDASVVVSIQ